jgi:hypothetical protein
MATSPFDRIHDDVRKDVPGVPEAILRQELFRVMDDFTQYTNIWQELIPVAIIPNLQSYALSVTTGAVCRLLFVYDEAMPTRNWPQAGIAMRVPGVMTLMINPTQAANWRALVAKRTSEPVGADNYPVLDDWIVDQYADGIGRGVLARLQFQPQKPWSNPMLAQPNQRAYIAARSAARVNDQHQNVFNNQSWRYPQSFAVGHRKGWV